MDIDRTIITENAQDTAEVGAAVARDVAGRKGSGARIVCLYGNLGAGKTTFTQGFAKSLGIQSRLLSPTFIIVRRYDIREDSRLFHIDLYRLETTAEMDELGLSEIFADTHAYVVIEWAEKLGVNLPPDRLDIFLTAMEDGRHEIRIKEIRST